MSTIVTRAGKGSPLTWNEVDNNFTNLNTDKYQSGSNVSLGTIAGTTITSSALTSGRVTFASTGGLLADSANLVWDNTNARLGIGTSSPATQLHLFTAAQATARIASTSYSMDILVQESTNTAAFRTNTATPIVFLTNSTEKMRLDSSGNLGLGVTPATWFSTYKALQISTNGSLVSNTDFFAFSNNSYVTAAGTETYLTTGFAGRYRQVTSTGSHQWYTAASGTAGTTVTDFSAAKMTLDVSGNLGLGVTPSAWGANKAIDIGTYASFAQFNATGGASVSSNAYNNGTNWIYRNTNPSTRYLADSTSGAHKWYTAPSGTAGTTITFTERMVLDSSGNLGLGVTPSAWYTATGFKALQFGAGALSSFSTTNFIMRQNAYAASGTATETYVNNGFASYYIQTAGSHGWATAPSGTAGNAITFTQAMTLDASGNLLVGRTSQHYAEKFGVRATVADWSVVFVNENVTNPYGMIVDYTGVAKNGTGNSFYYARDTAGIRYEIRSNGGMANYSANNVNLSDERVKKDIVNAGSYLDKICAIPVRTFLYKDQTDDDLNLGVIAQEVEAVAPELVDLSGFGDTPEDGVPLKAIYQTDLQYALMKCIQEQQAMIDELKAKVAALEAA
jgi:hypothetical protein